ncbi:endonuclease domain-containing protein [Streptomyces mutomycini]|uniref:endonuclease domain-containing protein n=1 Tax=Streptomyces mutomycini TaxID=284036 RepID=UPI0033F2AF7C
MPAGLQGQEDWPLRGEELKECCRCLVSKPIADFYKRKSGRDGRYAYCKECSRKYAKARYHLTAEKVKARQIEFKYGLTPELFAKVLESQGQACAVCGELSPGGRGNWHVDHDHGCCPGSKTCGKCVRGLLCMSCNSMLLPGYENLPKEMQDSRYINEYLARGYFYPLS